MPTAAGIVNAALELVVRNTQVSGTNPAFDGSPAGKAAGVLYTPAVNLLLRQLDPDFARTRLPLSLVGIPIPDSPWGYAYVYPAASLRLRQLAPLSGTYEPLDPLPVRGEVSFDPLDGKIILTNQVTAVAVFTSSGVTETVFDSGFVEALTRRLANPLAMALAGRPDFARELLDEAERYAGYAELSEEL